MDPTSKTLRVVRLNPSDPDPALDVAVMSRPVDGDSLSRAARYLVTRDESLLVFREAMAPTWFHLRRLSAAWMVDVLDGLFSAPAQRMLAFHAVEGDEMLTVAQPGSKGARFVATEAHHGVGLAPEEWVQEIADRFGLETVQEMGRVAIDLSRLPKAARGPFGYWAGSVASP
jgi:hypothetical protein